MTTGAPNRSGMRRYQLTVQGVLSERALHALGDGLVLSGGADGNTVLIGYLEDQADLHGLIVRLDDLGLALLDMHRLDDERGSR